LRVDAIKQQTALKKNEKRVFMRWNLKGKPGNLQVWDSMQDCAVMAQ
jgi:hypothetical protein